MGYTLYDLDMTDANNTSFAGISQAENVMRAPAVNNAFRALDGALARFIADGGGTVTTGGSANAQTVTLNQAIATTVPTGFFFTVKFGYTNTSTTVTLNVNSIGAKSVKVLRGGALADPAIGDIVAGYYGKFLYDGTYLVLLDCGLPQVRAIRTQLFTSSGTYTPDANMLYCIIECVGGGGGGGGCASSSNLGGGGGGGAGSYSRGVLSASAIGSSKVVTIGSAGGGGAVGNNAGSAGGNSSVGSLVTANGGAGGSGAAVNNFGPGGAGGSVGTATNGYGIAGQRGSGGSQSIAFAAQIAAGGAGGSSYYGGGAPATVAATAAASATGYGSGGAGGSDTGGGGARGGGNGLSGAVFITEFCSA